MCAAIEGLAAAARSALSSLPRRDEAVDSRNRQSNQSSVLHATTDDCLLNGGALKTAWGDVGESTSSWVSDFVVVVPSECGACDAMRDLQSR
jgi:hypothetical protein